MESLEYICLFYMSQALTWLGQAENLQHAQSGQWRLYTQWVRNSIGQHTSFDSKDSLIETKVKAARATVVASESGSIVLDMIDLIGKSLRRFFTGETQRLQVIDEADLYRVYKSAFGVSANPSIAQYIGLLGDTKRGIRILEIGAGLGGTTNDVLQRLRNEDGTSKAVQYQFTDTRPEFLREAAKRFSRDSAIMEFSKCTPDLSTCNYGLAFCMIRWGFRRLSRQSLCLSLHQMLTRFQAHLISKRTHRHKA